MASLEEIRTQYPEYSDVSDGDLLMGLHRKYYADMHPRQFLNSIDGAANAHVTISNPELKKHWRSGVSTPMEGENPRETGERLSGTSYGDVSHGGRTMSGLRSFAQGMTYGYADEAIGRAASAISGNSPEFEVERERRRLKVGEKEFPGQSVAAEIGGALALPGAAIRRPAMAIGAGTAGGITYASGKAEEGDRTKEALAAAPASLMFSALAVPAQRIVNKGVQRVFRGAQKKPSVGTLRRAKEAAYKQVDDSGFLFDAATIDDAYAEAQKRLLSPDSSYVKGDPKVERALRLFEKNSGQDMTLSQLDNLRSRIYKTWAAAPADEADAIIDIVKVIDETIDKAGGTPLLEPAREAHKTFMRVDYLDKEFQKAANNAAVSGSGGNVYNNYARVFKNILNNPTKSRMFTKEQLGFMQAAVDTSLTDDVMRKLGKLSPDGNGLMLALNVIGGSIEPSLLAVGGTGMVTKALSDRKMSQKADDIMAISAGQTPRRPVTTSSQVPTAASVGALSWEEKNR